MVPAMAEYSIIAIVLIVRPPTIRGSASFNWAVRMICSGDAPDAFATRTMLRLNIGLGSQQLYEEPLK